ncbi:MAG: hypothetical protein Q8L26_01710 [Candidatus Omnitrophota bacterium]|nr:hypothetical protein [Candidatus Omnitrophota bacterium]
MWKEEFYKVNKEEFFVAKYRWEFLRRNKFYLQDYKNIWLPVVGKNKSREIIKIMYYFKKKYGLMEPRPPHLPSPEYKKGGSDKFVVPFLPWIVICKELLLCEAILRDRKRIKKGFDKIHLEIDLKFPKKSIMKNVEEVIDNSLAILPKKYENVDSRKRFAHYEGYLKIFDLKNKGWTWNKLAKKFYKNDVDRNELNYAKRKVKRDYERCVKLVEGGFRQIR